MGSRWLVIALYALGLPACSGPAFETSDEERFELQTSIEPRPGEPSSDEAIDCGCYFLGSYEQRDYWACPLRASACIETAARNGS